MNPVLAILAPLVSGFSLPLFYIFWKARIPAFMVFAATASCLTSLSVIPTGWHGISVSPGGWGPFLGISLVVDPLSCSFLALASVGYSVSFIASIESSGTRPWRFYVLFFLSWASFNGIILTGDFFNLFVFFEIFSATAYLMVSYPSNSWMAVEASLKYLVFGTVGALFMLVGIAYSFMATGYLNLASLPDLYRSVSPATLSVIAGCTFVGLFVKSGAAPVHFWLPDAHSSARTPVSALLSGVLVKAPLYAIARLSFLLFAGSTVRVFPVMMTFGTLSVIFGHLMAFRQEDVKRLLAYSTVAQVGTVLVGLGCGSPLGVAAAVFHCFVHMISKMGLFLVAGVLIDDSGRRDIVGMRGLFPHRPLLVLAFCLLAASLAGIPPFGGFMSKWLLLRAAAEGGHKMAAIVLAGGTVISAAYYLRVAGAFFSRSDAVPPHRRPHPSTSRTVALLSLVCLLLSLVPLLPWGKSFLWSLGRYAADGDAYVSTVLP